MPTSEANANRAPSEQRLLERLGHGYELLRQGRLDDAAAAAESLLAEYRNDQRALVFASELALERDDPQAALDLNEEAIRISAQPLPLMVKKAQLLMRMRRKQAAREAAAVAAAAAGGQWQALHAIGRVCNGCNDPAAARNLFEAALALAPADPGLLHEIAAAEFYLGDTDAAAGHLERLLAQAPHAGYALYRRSVLRRRTDADNHVADIERRLGDPRLRPLDRGAALYALAKELEDLGQDERAFATLTDAAKSVRGTLRYDVAAECAAIDAMRDAYTAEALAGLSPGCTDGGAIFIVGLPRTGTTLTEVMLTRHGQARSAGELIDFGMLLSAAGARARRSQPQLSLLQATLTADFAEIGRDYLRGAREAAHGSPVFIDKMPVNYLYCGPIRQALPNARIIHVVRDPLDACYAIYKTLFNQAYHFSYDLEELATYYISYQRMMRHWHAAMPGAILDVRYEDLVADPEGQTRRMLDWCGLEPARQSLAPVAITSASALQAREPVHARSVRSSRKHLEGLKPLAERLAAAGVLDG
ncbi:MAG: sulfotransferase [Pseudoxanthomonas sp.]